MAKKELIFALMVVSIFLISACDVYNTLYVKQAGEAVEVPEEAIKIEGIEGINVSVEEEKEASVEEEKAVEEEKEIPEGANVIIVQETDLVSLVPKAEDPDKDVLAFAFTSPLDENGEWKTSYGDAGEYTVTVTASDGTLTTSKEILIVVNKKEEAPVFDSFKPENTAVEISETESVEFEVLASDLNKDELAYLWKLDGVEIGKENSVTYKTTYEDAGSHTAKVTVSDGGALDTEKIWSITVNNVNRKPVFEPINDLEVTENKTIEVELEAIDPDNDVISFSAENLPANSTLKENIFIFSPDFDFVKGKEKEQIEITFIANDAESKDEQTVSITVFNKNRAPDLIAIIQKQ